MPFMKFYHHSIMSGISVVERQFRKSSPVYRKKKKVPVKNHGDGLFPVEIAKVIKEDRRGMNEDGGTAPAAAVQPTAPDVFLQHLTNEVNKQDVYEMIEIQQHMLSRFEKTNEMLLNFNGLSNARYESTQREFRKHIQLLMDTRKDLDFVFRRIRYIKSRLSSQYPAAFAACTHVFEVPDDEDGAAEGSADTESAQPLKTPEHITNATVKSQRLHDGAKAPPGHMTSGVPQDSTNSPSQPAP